MYDTSYTDRSDFITKDSIDSLVLEKAPEFRDYLFFHNVLDKFCWLLRLHYSDRETVKRKRYRLDTLFQRFLLSARYTPEKARRRMAPDVKKEPLEYHLTKGWLNELVRSDPLHPDMVQFGTHLQRWGGPGSGGLSSWNVIQSYYALYEFLSSIVAATDLTIDTRGHRRVIRAFGSETMGKMRGRVLFYPFDLSSSTRPNQIPEHPAFCQFHYASYPRDPGVLIGELEHEVQCAFQFLEGSSTHSLFDLMYELRLWANYTGVTALMKLHDGGYQRFLMRNLGAIVYFAGGMAELVYMAVAGAGGYLGTLKRFSKDYIDKHERFGRNKYLIPAYIRLRSYKHLGLINHPIDFIIPPSADPVQFIDVQSRP